MPCPICGAADEEGKTCRTHFETSLGGIRITRITEETPMWRNPSDKPIYVDMTKSKVVAEDSGDAAYVLVGPRGEVTAAEAEKYGLTTPATPEAKHVDQPPANKAMPSPPATKKR